MNDVQPHQKLKEPSFFLFCQRRCHTRCLPSPATTLLPLHAAAPAIEGKPAQLFPRIRIVGC